MDLRVYYRKIREAEAVIAEQFPLVVSLETPDGGRPGVLMEVAKPVAAKLIVEGKAIIANEAQQLEHALQQEQKKAAAEKAELARRVQVAIIADPDLASKKK